MSDLILPQPGERIADDRGLVTRFWLQLLRSLVGRVNSPVAPSYTVATLPADAQSGALAFVTDETGGAVLASFDGSDWRRVTDRAVCS